MRSLLPVLALSVSVVQPAFAQGVKDPPNYPLANTQSSKKTQSAQEPSRPTAIRNIQGVAVQGVYKDGKLTAVKR